jgi:hypothetical protein
VYPQAHAPIVILLVSCWGKRSETLGVSPFERSL